MKQKREAQMMVRVTADEMRRVKSASEALGPAPATLARMALLEIVGRHESKGPALDPHLAMVIGRVKELGVDLTAINDDAQLAEIADFIGICRHAKGYGLDPKEELTKLLAARLEAQALQLSGT